MKYKIYNQDVIEWAKEYQKGKFHALISDAPYHLTSITKRFGKKNSAPVKVDEFFDGNGKSKGSSPYSRTSKGFMGQTWDGGDVAFRAETWEAICEHLYPGGFGMVFSASRNWHRLAVAIEDAGMIIHPTIFGWLNGQGFPKATRIDKRVDYHDGSQNWIGHRYGLQALKPAVEPIIVFQKPYEGKPLDNIVETGAGALNIDGGRIPTQDEYVINRFDDGAKPFGNGAGHEYTSTKIKPSRKHKGKVYDNVAEGYKRPGASMYQHKTDWEMQDGGRWPANFILDESVAPLLDAQTGNLKAGKATANSGAMGYHGGKRGSTPEMTYADDGGASRFFYNVQEQIDEADPIYYCGKVGKTERNAGLEDGNIHPTMKPIALAKYLATLLLPPEEYAPRRILVPFSGVGSEMIGCALAGWEHIVGIEFDAENGYVDMAHKRMEYWSNKK